MIYNNNNYAIAGSLLVEHTPGYLPNHESITGQWRFCNKPRKLSTSQYGAALSCIYVCIRVEPDDGNGLPRFEYSYA